MWDFTWNREVDEDVKNAERELTARAIWTVPLQT